MSKECVTHHYACDCREAKFAELEAENALLADRASNSVIAELRAELEFMSTIQEANDVEITALMEDNVKLEQQLAESIDRHEGLIEIAMREAKQLAELRVAGNKIISAIRTGLSQDELEAMEEFETLLKQGGEG